MSSTLELIEARPEHQPVLANLLELYIYDFSEFIPADLGEDGRFGYPNLSLYWSDPRRMPFLAKLDGKLAGFALVSKGSVITGDSDVWDMAEFFVLRRFRRRGFGTQLAQEVWRRLAGRWQIRVMAKNVPAREFWESAVRNFTHSTARPSVFMVNGVNWHLFSFESSCL